MAWTTEGGVPAVTVYIVDMRPRDPGDGGTTYVSRLCLIRLTLTAGGELVEEAVVAEVLGGPAEVLNLVCYVRAGGRLVAGPRVA